MYLPCSENAYFACVLSKSSNRERGGGYPPPTPSPARSLHSLARMTTLLQFCSNLYAKSTLNKLARVKLKKRVFSKSSYTPSNTSPHSVASLPRMFSSSPPAPLKFVLQNRACPYLEQISTMFWKDMLLAFEHKIYTFGSVKTVGKWDGV